MVPALEFDVAPLQADEFARPQSVPIREQDHRVVARAVTGFLGGAEKLRHFVAREVSTKALCGSHAPKLPLKPSPSSPHFRGGEREKCWRRSNERPHPSRRPSLPARLFWGERTRNRTPKGLRVAAGERRTTQGAFDPESSNQGLAT